MKRNREKRAPYIHANGFTQILYNSDGSTSHGYARFCCPATTTAPYILHLLIVFTGHKMLLGANLCVARMIGRKYVVPCQDGCRTLSSSHGALGTQCYT